MYVLMSYMILINYIYIYMCVSTKGNFLDVPDF